jgi:choline dehydrogenase-like flavoprotein
LLELGRAVGVQARVTDQERGKSFSVLVRAKTVIVAAGALNSPAILLRSGLENPHIGRHLHIHPTTTVAGTYSQRVASWQGVMQSAYSDEFSHLSGNYGYKLEVPPSHPGLFGLATPWYSARAYREQMRSVANTATIIVLTRDRGEGQVTLDRQGEPIINYVTSVFDRRHLLHGLQQAARVHFAAGALNVISLQNKRTTLERPENGQLSERDWRTFATQLERHGMASNRLIMFTAHQMGTCRLGADPRQSVVNEQQQVHGVKDLFVCDGSVFPAASGVNPMLSIMALAHRAAQHIKTTL